MSEPLYATISKHVNYEDIPKWNIIGKPLAIWANTNAMLDDYYKRPDVNIGDDEIGLNFKNTMRHIVAPAIMTQVYGGDFTRRLGGFKEARDLYAGQPFYDQIIDLRNNQKGIGFAIHNPNATKEDILEYALDRAIMDYEQDYNSNSLYELLIGK